MIDDWSAGDREKARAGSARSLRRKWGTQHLAKTARERIIFQGDEATYAEAYEASNGFEHGYLNMQEISKVATTRAVAGLALVREAILRSADIDENALVSLLGERFSRPLPSVRLAKYIRATLLGSAEGLAHPDEGYPKFRVTTTVESIVHREDGKMEVAPSEVLSWRFGDGTEARNVRFESWGPATVTSDSLEWSRRIVGEDLNSSTIPVAGQDGQDDGPPPTALST